jgi:hypothetical protein
MSEDRLEALRQRVSRMPVGKSTPKTESSRDRARHTFYLDKEVVKYIDNAFKAAVHDLYPLDIEKADFLEACLKFALSNQEEVKRLIQAEKENV